MPETTPPHLLRRTLAAIVAVATVASGGALLLGPAPARAASETATASAAAEAGLWDLTFEKGNRRCRLSLRSDPRAGGFALAMPTACHHAFPQLAGITNWTTGEDDHVVFHSEAGDPLLDFAPDGTAALKAVSTTGDVFSLMPTNPDVQYAIRMARVDGASAVAVAPSAAPAGVTADGVLVARTAASPKGTTRTAAAPAEDPQLPPVSAAEVAGNYAVLRNERDTGCMVTLEPGGSRAKLAPGCRDQGIVIFDPGAWQLAKGEIVLKSKRGHSTVLTRRDPKTWANAPARGAALVLKRL